MYVNFPVKKELIDSENDDNQMCSQYFPSASTSAGLNTGSESKPNVSHYFSDYIRDACQLAINNTEAYVNLGPPICYSPGFSNPPYICSSQNELYSLPESLNYSSSTSKAKDIKPATISGRISKSSKKVKQERKSPGSSPRKKTDRFDGIPEEDVAKKYLPDHITHNLDILIIGINPGLFAAHKGHHYAGPGNHFWKCLFLSGLVPEQFTAYDDFRMLDYGIGFTNMVARTTRGSSDLTRKEIAEGGEILRSKLKYYQPKIAVFNGKGIYEIFSGRKDFSFGKQPAKVDGTETHIWVMPSSSARCSQLPRAVDKVPFYVALRKLRDYLKGLYPQLQEEEVVFADLKLRSYKKVKSEVKEEGVD